MAGVRSFQRLCLCLYVLVTLFSSSSGVKTETTWSSAIGVREYSSFSSGRLQHFHIPQNCIKSSWLLSAFHEPSACEERSVVMFMQHGSFPLINPLNETFPDDFFLERTNAMEIRLSTEDKNVWFVLPSPPPGSMYSMAYIDGEEDDRILPGGIGSNCGYELEVTHIVHVYDFVPDVLMNTVIQLTNLTDLQPNLYRFLTSEYTWQYTVYISDCHFSPNNTNDTMTTTPACPLSVMTTSSAVPDSLDTSDSVECYESDCSIIVDSPMSASWHYVQFLVYESGSINLTMFIESKECEWSEDWRSGLIGDSILSDRDSENQPRLNTSTAAEISASSAETWISMNSTFSNTELFDELESNATCVRYESLGRFINANNAFRTSFYMKYETTFLDNVALVTDKTAMVYKFDIKPEVDSGATLKFMFSQSTQPDFQNQAEHLMEVEICIQKHRLPIDGSGIACSEFSSLIAERGNLQHVYFPYPESGPWFLALKAHCYHGYSNENRSSVPCLDEPVAVVFSLEISPCVEGGCGEYGSCRQYYSGVIHYTSCRCIANHRGYGCNDASVADSDGYQLRATLLLTLSNAAFIPAIVVALYRRLFVEALAYTYIMFFSTVYHACDGDRKYLYCIMPFGVLSFCDFFGAIMSFWITLVGMARLPQEVRAFCYVLGGLGLAVGIAWDRHNAWTFIVPTVCALIVMIVSWAVRCHHRRSCYPGLRRWFFCLVPGAVIAVAGLVIFAFFETNSNYLYTHSAWHACMALCLVFILPPPHGKPKGKADLRDEPSTVTDVRVMGVYSQELQENGTVVVVNEMDQNNAHPVNMAL